MEGLRTYIALPAKAFKWQLCSGRDFVHRKLVFATLELCGGVKKRAADMLGVSLKTLYNRLEEYGSQDGVPLSDPATRGVPGHGRILG